jgi:hypothetical protein
MIVSAAASRDDRPASYGPRSPSMIHRSPATSSLCLATHTSAGVGAGPGCQNSPSSSIAGMPVSSLS